ncbi:hypothetical protein CONLIGDRAFT_686708 [Coniochaeta ligniaria NRRL 30616]|uniref:Uncharacterized protein n=1 Tax=Coniochaeta ligniaria NRRL 30616 TaxID=1408157 RepID=A0A1J7I6K5_9PEZI|nr:hypothetical protein CONLIGDRAFT_686708 [Coniochaeta ligniaria NRRL 30616]
MPQIGTKDIFKEYLKDSFDPTKATVAALHKVLNSWLIDTEDDASKASLVDLFNQEIAPHKADILKMEAENKEREAQKEREEKAKKDEEGAGPSSRTRSKK